MYVLGRSVSQSHLKEVTKSKKRKRFFTFLIKKTFFVCFFLFAIFSKCNFSEAAASGPKKSNNIISKKKHLATYFIYSTHHLIFRHDDG